MTPKVGLRVDFAVITVWSLFHSLFFLSHRFGVQSVHRSACNQSTIGNTADPDAGNHTQISPHSERMSRLVVGYLVWIVSHSLSPSHLDCLYIEKQAASHSMYVSRRASVNVSKAVKPKKAKNRFSGLLNFGADSDDEDEDDDGDNAQNVDVVMTESSEIEKRYKEFMEMRQSPGKECVLVVESGPFRRDCDGDNDPGEWLVPLRVLHRNPQLQSSRYAGSLDTKNAQSFINSISAGDDALSTKLEAPREAREQLRDQFMKSLLGIIGNANDEEKSTEDTVLNVCSALPYSIVCGEINFRAIDVKSRADRLVRWTSNMNTFIAALWALCEEGGQFLSRKLLRHHSWHLIHHSLFSEPGTSNRVFLKRPLVADAFGVLCRGVLSHSDTFCVIKRESDPDGDCKMEDNETLSTKTNVAAQMHGLLVSCFHLHVFQVAVYFCCGPADDSAEKQVRDAKWFIVP